MVRYILSCVFVVLSLCAAGQSRRFTITGELAGSYTGKVILHYTLNSHAEVSDTSDIQHGVFRFRGEVPEPVQAMLQLEGLSTGAWVYLDSGNIQMKTHTNVFTDSKGRQVQNFQMLSISGSYSETLQGDFYTFWRALMASDNTDSAKAEILFRRLLALVDAQPNSNVGPDLLRDADMLTAAQANTIFQHLSKEQQQLAGSNGVQKLLLRVARTEPGKPYHYIALADTLGRSLSGALLPHRYMLIDFWASWCGPCRQENANLVSLYNRYHSAGFEILGISMDEHRPDWVKAIKHDRLSWPQVSDLKGAGGAAFQYYNLSYLPFNVLVDSKGIIVARDLKGKKLESVLAELFHEQARH